MAMLLVWVGRSIEIAIAIHLKEIESTPPKGVIGQVLLKLAWSKNIIIYNDTDRQWTNLDQNPHLCLDLVQVSKTVRKRNCYL